MKVSDIKIIQTYLKEEGLYPARIDGKRGPITDGAVKTALTNRADTLPLVWLEWPAKRKAVAYLQLLCHEHQIDAGPIDGFYGPQTLNAADQLKLLTKTGELPRGFGDIIPIRENPHNFPLETYENLLQYYGEPCIEEHFVRVTCPWTLRLDWNLNSTTSSIRIHEKLADSLGTVLEKVHDHYGIEGIKHLGLDRYGGSFVCRNKRGSLSAKSTHAWGIAIDWFPSRNQLRWDSQNASLAHPDLDTWWEFWEKEGWLSLGRSEDRDWMHVQAAKR
jgi:hypothetical protein